MRTRGRDELATEREKREQQGRRVRDRIVNKELRKKVSYIVGGMTGAIFPFFLSAAKLELAAQERTSTMRVFHYLTTLT